MKSVAQLAFEAWHKAMGIPQQGDAEHFNLLPARERAAWDAVAAVLAPEGEADGYITAVAEVQPETHTPHTVVDLDDPEVREKLDSARFVPIEAED